MTEQEQEPQISSPPLEFIKSLLEKFLPNNPDQAIQDILGQVQEKLPTPCIVLVGEPQVGKSSVARVLTNSKQIKIGFGDGIPVTEHVTAYSYPPESAYPLWTFLDTPGVGTKNPETEGAEFQEILNGEKQHKEQLIPTPHMILACVRVDDTELAILPWIKQWSQPIDNQQTLPLIVAQTCLHRIQYPHPKPYPFGEKGDQLPNENIPPETIEQIDKQREKIKQYRDDASFVVVDLTDPEDEVGDPFYGTDALLETVMSTLPQTIVQMLQAQRDAFDETFASNADRLVLHYSVIAAGAGAIPPPFGDIATLGMTLTMLRQLATQYRQKWEFQTVIDLLWSLGSTTLLWLAARYFIRRIPIPFLMAPVGAAGAFTLVYSVGQLMSWYYAEVHEGHQPTTEDIQAFWQKSQEESLSKWKETLAKTWKSEEP